MAAKEEVIIAVYKVNLHCRRCASEIKKPLLKRQGVQSVEVDVGKGEVKVKGVIDTAKIHKQLEKWSKKKVELISSSKITEKKTPAEIIYTTVLKVHIHCALCEKDIRKKLLKHKGIHSVKADTKAQTITVQGTLESTKLLTHIRKKIHKHAEIISSKNSKEEEEKKKKKEEEEKKKKKEEEEKKKKKEEVTKITEVVEFKENVMVEVKPKDGSTPYFVHYVYAPQLFSDENPNSCSII